MPQPQLGCVNVPGYDDLVKKADGELNAQQRQQDYLTIQKMLIDNAVVGFMYQQYEYDLVQPYVNINRTAFDDEYTPGNQNYNSAYVTTH